jgi:UDP-glucose 4-epimerase
VYFYIKLTIFGKKLKLNKMIVYVDSMKLLITGSSGQVGSYLVEHYRRKREKVIGIDLKPSPTTTAVVDIRDYTTIKNLGKGVDLVIHCAGQIEVGKSIEHPIDDAETNILGTLNVLRMCIHSNVKRFIYYSSAAIFGNPMYLPIDEAHPTNPVSPYGVSKLTGEKYTILYHKLYGLNTTVIRPFNIYSPRIDCPSVIVKFVSLHKKNKCLSIFGDGTQTRDYISVHDVVSFTDIVLQTEESIGEIFNCGTGIRTSVNEIVEIISKISNRNAKVEHLTPREGEIKDSYTSTGKSEKLGFKPGLDVYRGIKEVWEKL